MLKSIFLALSMLVVAPLAVQAAEITLVPAVTLHIGDQDSHGNYWDGGHWRDHGWWGNHYEWRGNRWQPHGHQDDRHDHHDNDHHDRHDDQWKHH
jgi:hypothetical protein